MAAKKKKSASKSSATKSTSAKPKSLLSFLYWTLNDPETQARFSNQPRKVMTEFGLKADVQKLILSRSKNRNDDFFKLDEVLLLVKRDLVRSGENVSSW